MSFCIIYNIIIYLSIESHLRALSCNCENNCAGNGVLEDRAKKFFAVKKKFSDELQFY